MELVNLLEVVFNSDFKSAVAYFAAGIAVFVGFATSIAQGKVAAKGVEAVGRQPEASGKIMVTMLLGQAVCETSALYGLIIAFMLLSK